MKIVALTLVTGPYIIARYTQFVRTYPEYNFTLIEFSELSGTYNWQNLNKEVSYRRIILSKKSAEDQSRLNLAWRIFCSLNRLQPDVVILCGYGVRGMLAGLFWSRICRKPSILLSDSKADDFPRHSFREFLKRLIICQYDSALVAGQSHRQYLNDLGIANKSIFAGYDVVGNNSFHPNKIKQLPNPSERPYLLSVSRFVPKKNLLNLIQAYADYRRRTSFPAWNLVLCGDGELRPQIKQKIRDLGLESSVHLPGFLQLDDMLPYYAHAKYFIHASLQEQWGLVVNEAMAAGLPVLVSNRCGCFQDLVLESTNGFGFNPQNIQQITSLMLKMHSDAVDLSYMGQASLSHIQNYSPETFAQELQKAIHYALANF